MPACHLPPGPGVVVPPLCLPACLPFTYTHSSSLHAWSAMPAWVAWEFWEHLPPYLPACRFGAFTPPALAPSFLPLFAVYTFEIYTHTPATHTLADWIWLPPLPSHTHLHTWMVSGNRCLPLHLGGVPLPHRWNICRHLYLPTCPLAWATLLTTHTQIACPCPLPWAATPLPPACLPWVLPYLAFWVPMPGCHLGWVVGWNRFCLPPHPHLPFPAQNPLFAFGTPALATASYLPLPFTLPHPACHLTLACPTPPCPPALCPRHLACLPACLTFPDPDSGPTTPS